MAEKIIVRFYSGYKGDETPRSLLVGSQEYAVEKVISRKRCLEKDSGRRYELFVCRVSGKTVKIRRQETGECELTSSIDIFPLSKK
jgi:hypothetical protein